MGIGLQCTRREMRSDRGDVPSIDTESANLQQKPSESSSWAQRTNTHTHRMGHSEYSLVYLRIIKNFK